MDIFEQAEQHQHYRMSHMAIWMAVAIVLLLLLAGCIAVWSVLRSPVELVVVPDATDIRVQSLGFDTQSITYRTAGKPYGWYFTLVRRLSADGWSAPVTSTRGIQNTPEVHWRISSFWLVYLEEQVALQGDPGVARITMRRTLIIPWRRYFQR